MYAFCAEHGITPNVCASEFDEFSRLTQVHAPGRAASRRGFRAESLHSGGRCRPGSYPSCERRRYGMDENGPKADHRSPRVRPQSALAPRVLCPGTQRARSLVGTPDGVSTSSTSSRTKRRFCSRACTSFARIATTRPDALADFFLQSGRYTFARALSALQDSTIKVSVVPSSFCT